MQNYPARGARITRSAEIRFAQIFPIIVWLFVTGYDEVSYYTIGAFIVGLVGAVIALTFIEDKWFWTN